MTRRVSCLIPTRNRQDLVVRAIASVGHQDYDGEIEIIVIDDGSQDDTVTCIGQSFPEVRVVSTPAAGPGSARNAGALRATGDVLCFLDDDDIWTDHHVTRLLACLAAGFPVAYGVAETIDPAGQRQFLIPEPEESCGGSCFEHLLRWCFLVPSAMAVEKDIFMAVGGFPELSFGEDWGLFLQLASRCSFGFAGEEIITRRYLHAGSICSRVDNAFLAESCMRLADFFRRDPRAARRFANLASWTRGSTEPFHSVQDWYVGLKKENLLCED